MSKILVIEDNETNRDLLGRRLRGLGHVVVMAPDAEEGRAKAVSEDPDLILMDVALPGMNGLAATRLLKSNEHTRHIPILVLTAHVSSRAQAFAAGCDDYATKPIAFAKLSEMIESLLAKKKVPHLS